MTDRHKPLSLRTPEPLRTGLCLIDTSKQTRDRAASRALQACLEARFGEHDVFVDVFDPSRLVDEDVKPIENSLSWGLVEIDEDLADAIGWLEQELPDALWGNRFAVENHWGQHAVACLRPLHQLAVNGVV